MRSAEAIAYGAATVVNAIASGKGAAVGVDLWTRAKVELNRDPGEITALIHGEPNERTALLTAVLRRVLRRNKASKTFGAHIETWSNIPIARGMKSSSVAANAAAIAATAALGRRIIDREIIEDGVEAALKAGVTITGAFDDASASYYGGVVVTDNIERRILRRESVPREYHALFHVPLEKSYTANVSLRELRKLAPISELAHGMALNGHYFEALTLNGLAHSVVLGCEPRVAIEAMAAGAVASGLTGKGPATVAIVKRRQVADVRRAMSKFGGRLVEARLNNGKAMVVARHT